MVTQLELTNARRDLLEIFAERSLVAKNKGRFVHYSQANKCDRHLANTLHPRQIRKPIPFINSTTKGKLMNNSAIAEEFRQYYSSLYNLPSQAPTFKPHGGTPPQDLPSYIQETALPTIPSSNSEELESALSDTDFIQAIKNLKSGKSPGPDGFSPRFYKTFPLLLSPLLAKVFSGTITPSATLPQAQIVVILKPGKDPASCPNYRPISLLNIDLKLFAKILANRISPFLPNIIHRDQVGFVPGREAGDNTTKTIHLIAYAQRTHTPTCLLSCDAEKASDRVSWSFLQSTLSQIGLGPRMLARIISLYSKLTATILTHGTQSDKFSIANSTRQGCPLSPLLFALVIEHLAQAIRMNPNIHGIQTPSSQCKLSLYADDLLLYVTQPHISIPSILAEINRFGHFSNYKLNVSKTEALNLSLTQNTLTTLKANFPFQWQTRSISYLGTAIPRCIN